LKTATVFVILGVKRTKGTQRLGARAIREYKENIQKKRRCDREVHASLKKLRKTQGGTKEATQKKKVDQ